jgi:hypothetical protein
MFLSGLWGLAAHDLRKLVECVFHSIRIAARRIPLAFQRLEAMSDDALGL